MNKELEFDEVTKPVIEWLNNNGKPHMSIRVTQKGAELFEGTKACIIDEIIY